jgi:hypothetical protein
MNKETFEKKSFKNQKVQEVMKAKFYFLFSSLFCVMRVLGKKNNKTKRKAMKKLKKNL